MAQSKWVISLMPKLNPVNNSGFALLTHRHERSYAETPFNGQRIDCLHANIVNDGRDRNSESLIPLGGVSYYEIRMLGSAKWCGAVLHSRDV